MIVSIYKGNFLFLQQIFYHMDSTSIILLCVHLMGSLLLFLLGIKYMSENLQYITNQRFRNDSARLTSHPMKVVFTGTSLTAAVPSSSATTVMVASFANARLLKLSNAMGDLDVAHHQPFLYLSKGIFYSRLYALLNKLDHHILNISETFVYTKLTNDDNII